MKTRWRHTLWGKLFLLIMLCVAALLLVNWLLNSFVLPGYYRHEKEEALETAFYRIDKLYRTSDADTLAEELHRMGDAGNISITVFNGERVVFQDRPDGLRDPLFMGGTLWPKTGAYTLQVSREDEPDRYIRLLGRLTNDYTVIMRVPLAAIEDSAAISNRFLLYTGVAALAVAALVALIGAHGFTRPIRRLSAQAAAVARLDFSQRYALKGSGELHALGQSLNTMSDSLQQAIAALKEDNRRQQQQNEARRAFMANVSHELKTPVALIQTYAEGLRENVADTEAARGAYCEVIEDEAAKMAGLIKKMTALMQLEEGREQLERESFDVSDLMRNLLFKNEPEIAARGLAATAPTQAAWVTADAYLIENVLTNYLTNALHHVPDGGQVHLTVTTVNNGAQRVSVYNSGSTIPQDDLPRIWESFYKVDKARTRAYGGSGIGLSLVAAIMHAHGAPYGVQLHPDGVEFYIELPAGEPDV